MSYKVLYRLYRPHNFLDVVGQKYIVKTLQNALIKNKVANAYLFCGPRGTGKTSVAKIVANSLNCSFFDGEPCGKCENCKEVIAGSHPDIIEFDAASHSRVENIRDILAQVNYASTLGRYKIYIIDEVHMLSNAAANALLKTLEEPPTNVVFILATTESQKVLATIQSRCQRYDFAKIEKHNLIANMANILENEKIAFEKNALDIIATLADGGMRDALSILEQCLAYNGERILTSNVKEIYGLVGTEALLTLLQKILNAKAKDVIQCLRKEVQSGADINRITIDLLNICKENLIYRETKDEKLLELTNLKQANDLVKVTNKKNLLSLLDNLQTVLLKGQTIDLLSSLEIALLKFMTTIPEEKNIEILNNESNELEDDLLLNTDLADFKEINKKQESEEKINNQDNYSAQNNLNYSYEQLGAYLLSATKEEKQTTEKIFENKLEEYAYDVNYRKFYSVIRDTKIFGTSKDFLLVSCEKEIAERINDAVFNKDLYFFLKNNLYLDKMIYAISLNEVENVKAAFFKCKVDKQVPLRLNKYKDDIPTSNKKEENVEDKLKELFGEKLIVEDK